MADYSELKRKAQEIRDEVKAGANTASRVGIAIEETVNALEAENVRAVAKEGSLQNDIQSILEGKLDIKDLGSGLRPDQAVSEIISYVRTNNIKSALVFKYIDTDNSSVFGICISRIGVIGWILYLVARKGIEVLKFNSYGSLETWNEYGGVLRHDMNSVADEQLECLSIKGLKSVLTTKQDALAPGDGITLADNVVSTLIGDGLAYNGREMVVSHDATLKTTGGKLGVNAGKGLYVNPDNKFGVHTGKGLTVNHDDGTVEVAEEVFDEIETKAPKVGYAPDLKVSYAEELVGRGESTPEVIGVIRPTSGKESSIKDGNATIERIKGESVVWNQLEPNHDFASGSLNSECVDISTANGIVSIGGVNIYTAFVYASKNNIEIRKNHVYLLSFEARSAQNIINRIAVYDKTVNRTLVPGLNISNITNSWNKHSVIQVATNDGTGSLLVYPAYSESLYSTLTDWQGKNFIIHDLTQMFGAGNEPTSIEEFEARKPLGVANEYNEGTIVSFQGGDVKSVGFNAWDGVKAKVIGGQKYYLGGTYTSIDFSKEIDGELTSIVVPSDKIYTPSEDGYIYAQGTDICIHLVHSGYRNGDYEPYVDDVHPLPYIKRIKDSNGDTLFPYGLLSAGSVHDEITATKAIKRIGVVDMGSIKWESSNSNGSIYMSAYGNTNLIIRTIKATPNATTLANLMTIPYQVGPATGLIASGDKKIARNANVESGALYVYDTDYTDATTFTEAMQGVLLYYELAEPIEVDLEEPLNMTYEAWDFGTEELLAKGATTPLNADIVYLFNAVDRIRENSRHVEESEAKLTSMEQRIAQLETMIASLTNTANDE